VFLQVEYQNRLQLTKYDVAASSHFHKQDASIIPFANNTVNEIYAK